MSLSKTDRLEPIQYLSTLRRRPKIGQNRSTRSYAVLTSRSTIGSSDEYRPNKQPIYGMGPPRLNNAPIMDTSNYSCICGQQSSAELICCSVCKSNKAHRHCVQPEPYVCPYCWIKTFTPTVTFYEHYVVVPYTVLSRRPVTFTIDGETKRNLNTGKMNMLCLCLEISKDGGYQINWSNALISVNNYRIAVDESKVCLKRTNLIGYSKFMKILPGKLV